VSGGLPQLDATQYPGEIFWLAVSFAVLYGLMACLALPVVRRTQEKRTLAIADDLESAHAANEEARVLLSHYEKTLAEARAKAQATVADIAAVAAQESAARQAARQQELDGHLAEAEARIFAARDKALGEVRSKAADLAAVIIDKITARG